MVRLWSEEVGDARVVIEPLVKGIDDAIEIEVDGGEGFRKDTVEVRLRKSGRQALCIVTFEAWANAKTDASEMEKAFRKIIGELGEGESLSAYLVTSSGLEREQPDKGAEILKDIAAGTEADILAQQLLKGAGRE
ncbi:MAG: hypothetical protein IH866_02340 [Chloroflexi bacterium]|nr:hypothetical protein [Chloroflexota bacterium]